MPFKLRCLKMPMPSLALTVPAGIRLAGLYSSASLGEQRVMELLNASVKHGLKNPDCVRRDETH